MIVIVMKIGTTGCPGYGEQLQSSLEAACVQSCLGLLRASMVVEF